MGCDKQQDEAKAYPGGGGPDMGIPGKPGGGPPNPGGWKPGGGAPGGTPMGGAPKGRGGARPPARNGFRLKKPNGDIIGRTWGHHTHASSRWHTTSRPRN